MIICSILRNSLVNLIYEACFLCVVGVGEGVRYFVKAPSDAFRGWLMLYIANNLEAYLYRSMVPW